jgi:hypothetical protein
MTAVLRSRRDIPRRLPVRALTRLAALIGVLLSLASCEGIVGTDSRPTIYVLRTINGIALPVNLNDFIDDGTEEGDWTILADTLFFFAGGRGEWRGSYRFHAPIGYRPSPDPGPRIDRYRQKFWYEGNGRTWTVGYHDCEDECLASTWHRETLDRLQPRRQILREWVYEQVRD